MQDGTDGLAALKRRARETWGAGDYDAVAEGIWSVGARVVTAARVAPGERVLDVACGTGNAAIRAAAVGAHVIGLDIAPELFEAARRRASEEGVEVDWVEGDAEELPFADGSFDVVLSTFGAMFAPRHRVVAAEMARVLPPGGRIGLATWARDGSVAGLFRVLSQALPAAPEIAAPPMEWGEESRVRDIFAGTGMQLAFSREAVDGGGEITSDEFVAFFLTHFGPLIKAREVLEPQQRWEALVEQLRPALARMHQEPGEYLVTVGTK